MREMLRRMEQEMQCLPADRRVCQGTLLSWSQYLVHVEQGEYEDARHVPRGRLSAEDTGHMTSVLLREQGGSHPTAMPATTQIRPPEELFDGDERQSNAA
jgi:hypothetical protein